MSKERIYPYAVAKVRVFEKRLLTQHTLNQMAEAKDAADALRILVEAGYTQAGQGPHDFEKMLSIELSNTYALVKELVPEENFIKVFLIKNDYHNIKTLLKADISGNDGSKYIIEGGTTVPIDVLKSSIADRNYSRINKFMENGILNAYELYGKSQSGQMIDLALDKAAFENMKAIADESNIDFVIKYVKTVCDLTNLKSFLRARRINNGSDLFKMAYVTGGSISIETFLSAFNSDSPSSVFRSTDYGAICEEGMSKGFTVFEKLCDNYIMESLRGAKYIALTVEPIIAFVYAKETEIKTVRIIMTSKLNNINADTIKERLRDAYV